MEINKFFFKKDTVKQGFPTSKLKIKIDNNWKQLQYEAWNNYYFGLTEGLSIFKKCLL